MWCSLTIPDSTLFLPRQTCDDSDRVYGERLLGHVLKGKTWLDFSCLWPHGFCPWNEAKIEQP